MGLPMFQLLLADDEYEILNGLSNYFPWNELGFEVCGTVEDGVAALRFMSQHKVDVLLCDVRMPLLSGIDVARELHQQKADTIVVFISGYREFEYVQQALVYGVRNYIVKPTRYKELAEVFTAVRKELEDRALAAKAQQQAALLHLQTKQLPDNYEDRIIQMIKQYVEENCKDASLEKVANLVHMNPYYVSKYFKQKTGENFSEYVIRVRMEKAAEMLANHPYKTYEVSHMVGYTNAKNFTRIFRKYFGKTPREFRRNEL